MLNETTAFASSHRQKKTWLTVLAVLAVLVVFATVAALTMPASAMTAPATPETAATGETVAPENDVLTQGNAAPSDTAQSDTVTEQAAAETAALPAAAQVPEGYTVQRTVRDEENGFAVTVYAPDGVIPEGAALSATLLTEGDEAYRQAEQALAEETDGSGYGFAALDIHLEDADGNEVEPNGDVFVSIDAAGLIPEDVDPESVTVQHHEEQPADADGTAVTVETVADAADETEGVVEVTPAEEAENNSTSTLQAPEDAPATEVQAAFTVDGFSTFTITYTVNSINYSRPVSVLLDGVEMTTEQLTTLLGSSPEIGLTDKNWTDVKNLIPGNIRDSITLTVDGTQTTYSFGYAANSVGIKLHYVRIFGSEGDWLRTNCSDRPRNDQNSVDTSPGDADWRILEFPEGETLRLYYFSKYSGETPDEIVTADTSNLISINLFDYTGSNINGVINGMGNYYDYDDYDETNGETFRFTGSSEVDWAGRDNANKPYYTYWTQRDGGVVQGIVQDQLGANGYPQLNRDYVTSMEDLFNPGNANNKAYTNLNHLFTYDADTNFYSFDSSLNFATINPRGDLGDSGNERDFTVYARPNNGTSDGSTGIPYFIPFNEYGTNQHINGDDEFANYHFGMTIATEFLMPRDGEIDGEDMIFSFSGDDDVWVYIDGVLILDMGGIHDSCSGTINFAEGTATVDKVYATNGTLQNNGSRTIYIGDALAAAYNTTWANKNLEQRTVGGEEHWFLPDYTQHDLSFFYLERGAVDSNCKIEFNLYTLQQNSIYVGKQLTGAEETTEGISNYLSNIEYQFRILDADAETETLFINEGTTYDLRSIETSEVVGSGRVGADGIFTVKAGQYAVFTGIDEDRGHYYVQELMDENYSAQFGHVTVSVEADGGSTGFSQDNGLTIGDVDFDGVISGGLDAGDGTGSVVFTNRVDIEKLSTLSIEKNILPGSKFDSNSFTVNVTMGGEPVPEGTTYQLYTGDSATPTTATVSDDGIITLAADQRAVFTVLTGTEFTVYETNGAGYHANYEATQQFANGDSYTYNLTRSEPDQTNGVTVSGTVGDIRGTDFGDDKKPTDGTNASMAVTLTNSSFAFNVSLPITKTLEGWQESSYQFNFNIVEANADRSEKEPPTEGITIVKPDAITIDSTASKTGYGYVNFEDSVTTGTYYFLVWEDDTEPVEKVSYDTSYYFVTVQVSSDSAGVESVKKYDSADDTEGANYTWNQATGLSFTNTYQGSVSLTIVKNIYGLQPRQVIKLVNGDYTPENESGLRFDVDYFRDENGASTDDYNKKETFVGDWTFDTSETLNKSENPFVDSIWSEDEIWAGDINETGVDLSQPNADQTSHYGKSSLTLKRDADGDLYYQYAITISDLNPEHWYHVWEQHYDVDNYHAESSVEASRNDNNTKVVSIAKNDHDGKAVAFQLQEDTTVTFTNYYTANLSFQKVNDDQTTTLQGAEFVLYYTDDAGAQHYCSEPGSDPDKWNVTSASNAYKFISGTNGLISITGLENDRVYCLVETKAPDGYQLPETVITINWGVDGTATVMNGDTPIISTEVTLNPGEESEEKLNCFRIKNSTGAELPETGGMGTTFLTIGGLLMMAAAVGGGCVLRRRRGREGN